jgi:uncharacterized iron-regulated membrane protein
MTTNKARWRQLHRTLAPIMLLPILLTLITGSIYQIADLADKGDSFGWLIELHKGHFGNINLEIIYPFLNALGLLVLAITGISMWFQTNRRPQRRS